MNTIKFIITIVSISLCVAQVNTEAMRTENATLGLTHSFIFDLSYFSGESEIIQLASSYKMDYLLKSNYYGFIKAEYNRAFEKGNEDFTNRGFIHFRTAKPITNKIDVEGFLQKETNHFINLENRELVGLGLRTNQFNNLYWGLGLMYESEEYNDIQQIQNNLKSTNYINYKSNISSILTFQNIIYYQFKTSKVNNYRILWESNLSIFATESISIHIKTFYRYDTNGNNHFELSNGLGIQF